MLIATQNFNVQGEPESCVGGLYQEVDQNLEKGVLEVRKGDLVRFNSTTNYAHLCLGELIRNTSTTPQTNHVLRKPIFGIFDVRRCVYAKGDVDEPKRNPQDIAMWQKYANFTATESKPTSDVQEQAELQQAIRLSLGMDQDEQSMRNEPASSSMNPLRARTSLGKLQ